MSRSLIIALLAVASLLPGTAAAQCGIRNTAFQAGEELNYQLYYNWKFIWVKAGTAQMKISSATYGGQEAYKCHLITRGNQRTDRYFMMRDTLESYVRLDCTPLYYRKGALEGKRYNVDEVRYSYPGNGKVVLSQRYRNHRGEVSTRSYESSVCLFDMLSMLLRARSFDASQYNTGQVIKFHMCDGDEVTQSQIVYKGKKTFTMEDSDVKYRCLVFTFVEVEGGKQKDIVTFYVTDDLNHLPVRLDLNLKFGIAKAFLTSSKGLRNRQTSIIGDNQLVGE